MDALARQLAELEPAQRWSLLCRLAREYPGPVQHALNQIQAVPRKISPLIDWHINGVPHPEAEAESLIAS